MKSTLRSKLMSLKTVVLFVSIWCLSTLAISVCWKTAEETAPSSGEPTYCGPVQPDGKRLCFDYQLIHPGVYNCEAVAAGLNQCRAKTFYPRECKGGCEYDGAGNFVTCIEKKCDDLVNQGIPGSVSAGKACY